MPVGLYRLLDCSVVARKHAVLHSNHVASMRAGGEGAVRSCMLARSRPASHFAACEMLSTRESAAQCHFAVCYYHLERVAFPPTAALAISWQDMCAFQNKKQLTWLRCRPPDPQRFLPLLPLSAVELGPVCSGTLHEETEGAMLIDCFAV